MSYSQRCYLLFLHLCTRLQLAKYSPQIIGITGSAGKSSAVLATYIVLHSQYKEAVQYTKKGNSETGIPFEVLHIPVENYQGIHWLAPLFLSVWRLMTYWPSFQFFVVEMGVDSERPPKNMSYQLSMIQPKVGVLLNVSSVHGENYSGSDVVQAIANEKRKLLSAIPKDGLVIYSADHPQILYDNPAFLAQKATFSVKQKKADIELKKYTVDLNGTSFQFTHAEKNYEMHFSKQLHTQAAFGGFATALLTGLTFNIPIHQSLEALQDHFLLPPGRMTLFEGIQHTTLIDSTYNSSPEATAYSLDMLAQIKTGGRKITVLGDMRELGVASASAHQELADHAEQVADLLIWVGPLTKKYCYQYLQEKKTEKINLYFTTAWDVIEPLKKQLQSNDLILLKGSQNTILLEIIVEALVKNSTDIAQLCRRETYWQQKRIALQKDAA